jgi:ABC-type sugar transport system ATPase subunit
LPTVLEMRNITKRFGDVTVLNRVRIDLRAGEMLALVGENGAGKSPVRATRNPPASR